MQGNGVARDKLKFRDKDLFIFDMYNTDIWPGDTQALEGISHQENVRSGCRDAPYLQQLDKGLKHSFEHFKPDIVLYNAGTDVLQGDPLGHLQVCVQLNHTSTGCLTETCCIDIVLTIQQYMERV